MKSPALIPKLLFCVVSGSMLPGCSLFGLHTKSQLGNAREAAYERGVENGRAAEIRERHHQDLRALELPPPPPPKRYYSIPVRGHTTADGIRIEDHSVTLEVVRP